MPRGRDVFDEVGSEEAFGRVGVVFVDDLRDKAPNYSLVLFRYGVLLLSYSLKIAASSGHFSQPR